MKKNPNSQNRQTQNPRSTAQKDDQSQNCQNKKQTGAQNNKQDPSSRT